MNLITSLPVDIIYSFVLWFYENKDTISLSSVCKDWKRLFDETGYIRKMRLTNRVNGIDWIRHFISHKQTIDSIYIANQTDPAMWIIEFPRMVHFSECVLTQPLIPNGKNPCRTEVLIFRNMTVRNTVFNTDWSLFPNLRRLVIYVSSCNMNGLMELKNLHTVCIYTDNGTYKLDR